MVKQMKYVFVIGFSRSGTTALYNYLADHPEISTANRKELNFFNRINTDLPLSIGELRCLFDSKFSDSSGVKIDATPDYISNRNGLKLISAMFKQTEYRVVILVRNRYDRIKSWFKYARMKGLIQHGDKLEDIICNKIEHVSENALKLYDQQHALNFYASIIEEVKSLIPEDNIIIIKNGELNDNPTRVLLSLAERIEIGPEFFATYRFKAFNMSKVSDGIGFRFWLDAKRWLRKHYSPRFIRAIARKTKRIINPDLKKKDTTKLTDPVESLYNSYFVQDEITLNRKFSKYFINEN